MRTLTITENQLAVALETWETEAKAANWPDRTDAERHADNAAYLFDKLETQAAG